MFLWRGKQLVGPRFARRDVDVIVIKNDYVVIKKEK